MNDNNKSHRLPSGCGFDYTNMKFHTYIYIYFTKRLTKNKKITNLYSFRIIIALKKKPVNGIYNF